MGCLQVLGVARPGRNGGLLWRNKAKAQQRYELQSGRRWRPAFLHTTNKCRIILCTLISWIMIHIITECVCIPEEDWQWLIHLKWVSYMMGDKVIIWWKISKSTASKGGMDQPCQDSRGDRLCPALKASIRQGWWREWESRLEEEWNQEELSGD